MRARALFRKLRSSLNGMLILILLPTIVALGACDADEKAPTPTAQTPPAQEAQSPAKAETVEAQTPAEPVETKVEPTVIIEEPEPRRDETWSADRGACP